MPGSAASIAGRAASRDRRLRARLRRTRLARRLPLARFTRRTRFARRARLARRLTFARRLPSRGVCCPRVAGAAHVADVAPRRLALAPSLTVPAWPCAPCCGRASPRPPRLSRPRRGVRRAGPGRDCARGRPVSRLRSRASRRGSRRSRGVSRAGGAGIAGFRLEPAQHPGEPAARCLRCPGGAAGAGGGVPDRRRLRGRDALDHGFLSRLLRLFLHLLDADRAPRAA